MFNHGTHYKDPAVGEMYFVWSVKFSVYDVSVYDTPKNLAVTGHEFAVRMPLGTLVMVVGVIPQDDNVSTIEVLGGDFHGWIREINNVYCLTKP